MALHGEIKINGYTIGWWKAVRKEQVSGNETDPMFRYECAVSIDGELKNFSIEHWYEDGAPYLIQKLMREFHFVKTAGIETQP